MKKLITLLLTVTITLTSYSQSKDTTKTAKIPNPKDTTLVDYRMGDKDWDAAYNYVNGQIYKTGWNNANLQQILILLITYMNQNGKSKKVN